MEYELKNKWLSVKVKRKGAEWSGLRSLASNQEYLWQADPAHWGRHSCVLFPIVGKLKDNQFRYQGRAYTMPQHGFARDMEFTEVSRDNTSLELCLEQTPETLSMYPFVFRLTVSYILEDNTLQIRYLVENTGEDFLYFSIGAHPAFNCQVVKGRSRSDYKLRFDKRESAYVYYLKDGLFSGDSGLILDSEHDLRLADDLFDRDALIFKSLSSKAVALMQGELEILRLNFPETPYLGIWSKSRVSPFVCIEPWFGLADHHDFNGELPDKEGICHLAPGELFTCTHSVMVAM